MNSTFGYSLIVGISCLAIGIYIGMAIVRNAVRKYLRDHSDYIEDCIKEGEDL